MSTARDYVENPAAVIYRPYGALKRLVTSPDEFFQRALDREGLRKEFIVVLLIGVAGFLPMVYVVQTIQSAFGAGLFSTEGAALSPGVHLSLWGRAFQILLGAFGLWLAYSVVFLCTSWLWKAAGGFYDLLRVTAWGMIPVFVGNLIYFGVLAIAFVVVDPAEQLKGFGRSQMVQYLINQGATEWYAITAYLVMVASVLAAGYLFVYGVKHARALSEDDARKAVLAPVAAHAIYLVYILLQHTIWFPDL